MWPGQTEGSLCQRWFKLKSCQRSSTFYVFIFILTIFNFFVLFSINSTRSLKRNTWLSMWRSDEPLSQYDAVGILNIVLTNASGELKDGKISMEVLSKVLTKIKNDAYAMEQRVIDQDAEKIEEVISAVSDSLMQEETLQQIPSDVLMKLREAIPLIKDVSPNSTQNTLLLQAGHSIVELHAREAQRKEKRKKNAQKEKKLNSCSEDHEKLDGLIKPNMTALGEDELADLFPYISQGGSFTPTSCRPKEKTAIIFPFRNRETHLHILLLNLIPILKKQMVDFTIFVIDQVLPGSFNRGMLFNVGFLEALKMDHYDCFIFHDVDLLPINDKNFYHCNNAPTHFLSGVDKFKYKLLYKSMFGGIVGMTIDQFLTVNGCSNLYFGWGGEDDDLHKRVEAEGYTPIRKYQGIGLYDMIKHHRDDTNKANPVRKLILKSAVRRMHAEGLNTAVYTSLGTTQLPLYTKVSVRLNSSIVEQTAPGYLSSILEARHKQETST